ncbi:MAG TPA: bifunctional DNA-formamidopyrimidine glycosylase/DNA-(apurinic or apyrimidinic site) lyase [Clostridiaceae bacterium]|nr:bifunctional DNA-formamidopyrimidine glycosylase/DNA-(apurinic or apyrimidinic site) lyase [Clostridiaceae bacterium]
MPELPEVETIRRSLVPLIKGYEIIKTDIFHPDVLINAGKRPLRGWLITDLRRRGKYLLIDLINTNKKHSGALLMIHFRMTGKLLHRTEEIVPTKHTHIRFHLQGPTKSWLDFEDVRRFGRIWLLAAFGERENPGLAGLGPEPLSEDWTYQSFREKIQRRKTSIKATLLDQTVVAGIGNIYGDEALFLAGINPQRKASSLSPEETIKLQDAVRFVLTDGIGHRGTSFRDYVDGLGGKGYFQQFLKVYQREGQKCAICGNQIVKKKVAGRGTHFCPHCQK